MVGISVAWVTACGATTVCKTAVAAGVAAGVVVSALVQATPAKSRQIAITGI
jgi:alkaline phosphatase